MPQRDHLDVMQPDKMSEWKTEQDDFSDAHLSGALSCLTVTELIQLSATQTFGNENNALTTIWRPLATPRRRRMTTC